MAAGRMRSTRRLRSWIVEQVCERACARGLQGQNRCCTVRIIIDDDDDDELSSSPEDECGRDETRFSPDLKHQI